MVLKRRPCWRLETAEEIAGVDPESGRNFQDVVEGRIDLSSLESGEVGPVDAATSGGGFLAQFQFQPPRPYPFPENPRGW